MSEFTDSPKLLRKRQLQEEAFERAQAQADEELRKFFRENAPKMAREFQSNIDQPHQSDPELAKWLRNNEGGGFGGVVSGEDD